MNNFEAIQKQSQDALESTVKSYEAVNKGIQELAKENADYTKSAYENGVAHWEKLVASKSFDKAVEVQTAFAKSAYESFVAQANKIGEIYTSMAKEAYKPYENTIEKTMPKAAK